MMPPRLFVVMVVMVVAVAVEGQDKERLRETLLKGYDKNTLPQTPTVVNISQLTITDLEMTYLAPVFYSWQYGERHHRHRLTLHAWLNMTWHDERLSWKAEDYGGVQKLSFSPQDVWLPGLSSYNVEEDKSTLYLSRFRVIVTPDGKVLDVSSLKLFYTCASDFTYWPHDIRNCSIKIGSWGHSGSSIDINVDKNFADSIEMDANKSLDVEMDTMEWMIKNISLRRESKFDDCCTEPFVSVLMNLVVQREAPAYCWIIKTPAVCLVLLTAVLFILPPDTGEKIVFGGVNIFLNLLLLVFTHDIVRNAPSHTPLLVQLITIQLVLAVASTLIAAMLVRTSRGPYTSSPSPGLHRFTLTLAPILCLSSYAKQASGQGRLGPGTQKSEEVEMGSEADGGRSGEQSMVAGQWLLLGAVLNRFALGLYLGIGLIMLIRSSSVL